MRYITESRYKGPKHVRIRTRFVTGSIAIGPIWLNVGGRKPLAHLPALAAAPAAPSVDSVAHPMSYASARLREFHEVFEVPALTKVGNGYPGADELAEQRLILHDEENDELYDALREVTNARQHQLMAVAEELADVMVVAYGTADLLGIDLDVAFRLKMDANMAKLPTCGECGGRGWRGVWEKSHQPQFGGGHEHEPTHCCQSCSGTGKGKPIKRADGKIERPEGWQKPSMAEAIR